MSAARNFDFQTLTPALQQFCNAVLSEDYKTATRLIQNTNINLDSPVNASNESLLCIFASEGRRDACLFLLSNGASLNGSPETPNTNAPIANAFRSNHSDLAKELAQYIFQNPGKKYDPKIAFGDSILFAVSTGDLSLLEYLIQQKANINATDKNGQTALHMLVYHLTNETPITAKLNPIQFTQILLKAGINVNLTCAETVTEDRRCPFIPDFPDPVLVTEQLRTRSALEIANSRIDSTCRVLGKPEKDWNLLMEFINLIEKWPLQLQRKQGLTHSLNFFPRQLIALVNDYAVPDNTVESKPTQLTTPNM